MCLLRHLRRERRVKLNVIVTLGVALGSIVGVHQDVVKLGAAESAGAAETYVETRGLVL